MKNEIPVLEKLGPVPFWRGTEKCREALAEMYGKAMRSAAAACKNSERFGKISDMKRIFILLAFAATSAFAANVTDVSVKTLDGFGGDASSVLARCQTRKGAVYDESVLSRDVANLKASNEYQDISADAVRTADGVEVTFIVSRKMRFVAPASVQGAKALSESKILKEAKLRDGALYGDGDLAEAAARVRAAYRKKHYFKAKVVPVAEALPSGDGVSVSFVIDEGERMKPSKFVFKGAAPQHEKPLRSAIGEYPWWNPMGWFSDSLLEEGQPEQAIAKMTEYYRNLGHLDVKVSGPAIEPSGNGRADVVYTVEEGPLYTIGECAITGVKTYSPKAVEDMSDLPAKGTAAGAKTIADAARRIEIVVGSGEAGLAESHVAVKQICSASEGGDKGVVDLVFEVEEGRPVVIDAIRIEGNDYTKDKVIRREISLSPGGRMHEDKADKSKSRIENLNYFSRVRYYLRDTGRGVNEKGELYRDLVYEVEEKNTGSFMVGVGASSVDSVFVSAEVSQSNFDIFAPGKYFRGGGQKGRLYAQVGPRIQTYEASVTEPWFFDRQLELTVEGYRRQRWYDEYDIIRSGAAATLSYPVKFWNPRRLWRSDADRYVTFGRFGFRFSTELVSFDDVDGGVWEYKGKEVSLKEEKRKYNDAVEPVLRTFWSRETTDSAFMPTTGTRTMAFFDLAAAGDNKFWKAGFTHRAYFNVWKKYGHVLAFRLRGETIDGIGDDLPIYNRLFLGGPKSIRGIEYRHVSPMARKQNSNSWTPWGGQTLVCGTAEYTVPIVNMLRVAAFTDVGSVSEDEFDVSDDFAWTVGVGFRIDIPMFPVRFDLATPVEKPDHASKEVFSFSVGYDF